MGSCGNCPQHHGPLSLGLNPSLPHCPGCLEESGSPPQGQDPQSSPWDRSQRGLWILLMITTIYCLLSATALHALPHLILTTTHRRCSCSHFIGAGPGSERLSNLPQAAQAESHIEKECSCSYVLLCPIISSPGLDAHQSQKHVVSNCDFSAGPEAFSVEKVNLQPKSYLWTGSRPPPHQSSLHSRDILDTLSIKP